MVVQKGEQYCLVTADHRAVQGVAHPQLVRPARLETAEDVPICKRAPRHAHPAEMPLYGPLVRRPTLGRSDYLADVSRGAGGGLPPERLGHGEELRWHLGRQRPRLGFERLEAAAPPGTDPLVQGGPAEPDFLPVRAGVGFAGQCPHQPAALGFGQRRVGRLPDERVTEQGHFCGPVSEFHSCLLYAPLGLRAGGRKRDCRPFTRSSRASSCCKAASPRSEPTPRTKAGGARGAMTPPGRLSRPPPARLRGLSRTGR